MGRRLGIEVRETELRAVVVRGHRLLWAAETGWSEEADLRDSLARLAAERPGHTVVAHVALAPELSQWRTVVLKPALSRHELLRHVSLVPRRYFLQSRERLVTDVIVKRSGTRTKAETETVMAACPEPIVEAVFAGLGEAGVFVAAVRPSVEWQRQAGIQETEMDAERVPEEYRTAFLAAVGRETGLMLIPDRERELRQRSATSTSRLWIAAALISVVLATTVYFADLLRERRVAEENLASLSGSLARTLAARRDLDAATDALQRLGESSAARTTYAHLLEGVSSVLPDSAFVTSLRITTDGRMVMTGLARRAAMLPAALQRLPQASSAALYGPVARELFNATEYDRYMVVVQLREAVR